MAEKERGLRSRDGIRDADSHRKPVHQGEVDNVLSPQLKETKAEIRFWLFIEYIQRYDGQTTREERGEVRGKAGQNVSTK